MKRKIILAGLPSSGKSTLARKLGSRILEYDSIALKFGTYEELNEEREFANRQFLLAAKFGQYDIIVDVFHTRESRQAIASAFYIKPDLILAYCPLEECIRRNSLRLGSMVSNEEIAGLERVFEPVYLNEGFNSVKIYDTMHNRFIGGM